jgi:hypothetical protein
VSHVTRSFVLNCWRWLFDNEKLPGPADAETGFYFYIITCRVYPCQCLLISLALVGCVLWIVAFCILMFPIGILLLCVTLSYPPGNAHHGFHFVCGICEKTNPLKQSHKDFKGFLQLDWDL